MIELSEEEFGYLVEDALDLIPDGLAALMDNVIIAVEDSPPAHDPDLLGLYEGTPRTERGTAYAGVLPDCITVYRLPILAMCSDVPEVTREVATTVVHEVAHHFGIDDDRLHELGWG